MVSYLKRVSFKGVFKNANSYVAQALFYAEQKVSKLEVVHSVM